MESLGRRRGSFRVTRHDQRLGQKTTANRKGCVASERADHVGWRKWRIKCKSPDMLNMKRFPVGNFGAGNGSRGQTVACKGRKREQRSRDAQIRVHGRN